MIDKTIEEAAWNFARKQWGEEAAWNFARKQWGKQIPHTLDKIAELEEKSCTDTCTDDCSSQCKSQDFGTIVKDSFRNERRLNIAAQIVTSMVGSDDWTTWRGGSNKEIWHNMAKSSLEIADALLAEVEKKGDEE